MTLVNILAAVIAAGILAHRWRQTRARVTPLDFAQTPRRTEGWTLADGPWPRNRGWHHKHTPTRRVARAFGSQALHRARRIARGIPR
jgi:hypothetical protein